MVYLFVYYKKYIIIFVKYSFYCTGLRKDAIILNFILRKIIFGELYTKSHPPPVAEGGMRKSVPVYNYRF